MAGSDVPKARVVRKLLELRAREAPLGFSGYRGVLSQKAIAEVADVPVHEVTRPRSSWTGRCRRPRRKRSMRRRSAPLR